MEASSDDDGWAHLGSVGNIIAKQRPDFDARNYAHAKLSELMAATTLFELDPRTPHDGKAAVIYVRDKRHPSAHSRADEPVRQERTSIWTTARSCNTNATASSRREKTGRCASVTGRLGPVSCG